MPGLPKKHQKPITFCGGAASWAGKNEHRLRKRISPPPDRTFFGLLSPGGPPRVDFPRGFPLVLPLLVSKATEKVVTSLSFCSFLKHSHEETPPPNEGLIQADFPGRTSLYGRREAENGLREVVVLLTLGNFLSTATLKTEQNALEVSIFLLNQRSHDHNPWSTIPINIPGSYSMVHYPNPGSQIP